MDALKLLGDKEPVDMSLACMCETIDALGLTGFDKPYHNIECFKEGQPAHMLNVRPPVCIHLAAAFGHDKAYNASRSVLWYLCYAFVCSARKWACIQTCMQIPPPPHSPPPHPPITFPQSHDVDETTCLRATVDCIVQTWQAILHSICINSRCKSCFK